MIKLELIRNPTTVPYYKLFSYFHKLRILMQLFNRFFQFLKRRFFPFHTIDGNSELYKFY